MAGASWARCSEYVPMLGGGVRLAELASDSATTETNRRFVEAPTPIILHIVTATLFSLVGAFQFAPSLRGRGQRWHRMAGRVLLPSGFVVALSGLWMTAAYDPPSTDNELLALFRFIAGSWMLVSLVLAVVMLFRRSYRKHGAWMARAYAIGLGAGTQVLTTLPWVVIVGKPTPMERSWLMFAGWFINVVFIEYKLRHQSN